MRRPVSHSSNMNYTGGLVHIVEDAIFSDSDFPRRGKMFPGRNQATQQLSISGLHGRFVQELNVNGLDHSLSHDRGQRRNFGGASSTTSI